jgi:AcrR family transcriptional regulator
VTAGRRGPTSTLLAMAATDSPTPRRRPIGRPRLLDRPPVDSPRDGIVLAAGRLFAEFGYADVTMSDIARAAGLQQSSVYYWFRRKELILQATLEVNRLPVEFLRRITGEPGPPSVKLYRLLRFDTYQLCVSPLDVNEVERLAEQQPDVFAEYWEDNQRLYDGVCGLVQSGIDAGEFVECDAALAGLALLSTQEGMQKRFRHQKLHTPEAGNPFTYRAYASEQFAESVADAALRSLLRRPVGLARARAAAAAAADF